MDQAIDVSDSHLKKNIYWVLVLVVSPTSLGMKKILDIQER